MDGNLRLFSRTGRNYINNKTDIRGYIYFSAVLTKRSKFCIYIRALKNGFFQGRKKKQPMCETCSVWCGVSNNYADIIWQRSLVIKTAQIGLRRRRQSPDKISTELCGTPKLIFVDQVEELTRLLQKPKYFTASTRYRLYMQSEQNEFNVYSHVLFCMINFNIILTSKLVNPK